MPSRWITRSEAALSKVVKEMISDTANCANAKDSAAPAASVTKPFPHAVFTSRQAISMHGENGSSSVGLCKPECCGSFFFHCPKSPTLLLDEVATVLLHIIALLHRKCGGKKRIVSASAFMRAKMG